MFPVYEVVFFIFAAVLITSAAMVVVSRSPVHAVLFLILAFFTSAVLWMMMQEEFLSLVLIFVYVGAVMTLFLFVVMMLNIDFLNLQQKFVRLLPFVLVVMVLLVGVMINIVNPRHFQLAIAYLPQTEPDFSNVKAIGSLLYVDYSYPFEIAAVILLVAIIAAITLAFHGRKPNTQYQRIQEQLAATKKNRLRVIKMKTENS